MQDVEKTEIQRDTSARRRRCRNRMQPLYSLVVFVLVIGVGVALCMTVFFNIQTIQIAGESAEYTVEEIAQASGVHTGDNLMRLDCAEVEQNVLDRLVFVDSVRVEKEFPDVLVITVTPSEPAYNLVDDSGTLQVSAAGKILKSSPETDASFPTIIGFDPMTRELGKTLASNDSQKDEIFETLSELMTKGLEYLITEIDMTDKYDIVLTLDGRIEFSLGNWSELSYKVAMAETVLSELSSDKVGYLMMVGDHQCSYRDKDTVDQQTATPVVTTQTDENGNLVEAETTETTAVAETVE
ncbi:MAG: FtsQ-type POTRA domain-containing protein [Ruminococcus sp.]|nr:FtsQ-type POTRA domain-containing protein [Ruminococcus sp.]